MTLEQVITAGQQFTKPQFVWLWANTENWIIALFIIFVVTFLITHLIAEESLEFTVKLNVIGTLCLFIFCSFIFSTHTYFENSDQYNTQKKYWMNVYVKPYISELPIRTSPIQFIENNNSEKPPKFSKAMNMPTSILIGNQIRIIYLLDGEKKEESDYFDILKDLNKGELLILKGNYLTQDLGHGVDKGLYNSVIHAPDGFKL